MQHAPAVLKIALKALRTNKMRSALTMLGMVVGVGAVIAMVAVGQGASERVETQIESLGSNLLVVQPGSNNAGGVRNGWGNSVTLTRDDAEAIATQLPAVAYVAASVRRNAQIVYDGNNWFTRIEGVTPQYLTVRNFEVNRGSNFTASDDQAARKVALVGQTVVDQIFGGEDPVGQSGRRHPGAPDNRQAKATGKELGQCAERAEYLRAGALRRAHAPSGSAGQ